MKDKIYSSYNWSERFKYTIFTIGKLGLLIHLILIIYFIVVQVKEMAVYNVFSAVFFGIMLYLINKEYNVRTIFLIASFEIVLHTYLATYYIGSESNFIFFIFILPSVFLLNPHWKTWQSYSYFLVIVFSYIGNIILFKDHEAIYKLNEVVIYYTNVAMVLTVGFMIFMSVFYYSKLVFINDKSIREANKVLLYKNEEKSLIIKEIHHRIKNNLQVVISLLRLQSSKIEDEVVVEMFKNTQKRIFSMALLHESLLQEYTLDVINAQEYFKHLTDNLIESYAVGKQIKVNLSVESIDFSMQTLTPLGLIVNEIITNSLKHAFKQVQEGLITINLYEKSKNKYLLQIADNGVGHKATTASNNGLGTKLISIFVRQLNGSVEVLSNKGTQYNIVFEQIEHT